MSLRIRTNVSSLQAQRYLTNNNNNLGSSYQKLSSGHRINQSKDDAAGLAISEKLRGTIRGQNQAKRNANDAISMVQIAEGGMQEMSNILIRMRELSVQSASDTVGDQERGFLNREYTQLADEIDRIAATTEFNGNKFFVPNEGGEDRTSYVIQVGTKGTEPEANQDTISINLEGLRFTTEDLGIGKGAEIGPSGGEDTPTRAEIASKLGAIDDSLSRLASERATLGAMQSRLTSTVDSLSISVENNQTAKSRIRDVDFAAETARLTQSKILTQSSLSVLSQANATPEMTLQLLR